MKKIFQTIPLFYSKFLWKKVDKPVTQPAPNEKLPSPSVEDINFLVGDKVGSASEWFSSRATEVLMKGGRLDIMVKQAVETQTKELRDRLDTVEKKHDILEKRVSKQDELLAAQQKQVDEQGEQIKTMKAQIDARDAQLKKQEEILKKQEALIAKLTSTQDIHDTTLLDYDTKIDVLGEEQEQTDTTLLDHDRKINVLGEEQEQTDTTLLDHDAKISVLDETFVKVEGTQLTQGETLVDHKQRLDGVNKEIIQIDSEVAEISDDVDNLGKRANQADQDRAQLNESDFALNEKILAQGDQLTTIEEQLEELNQKIANLDLSKGTGQIEEELKTLTDQVNILFSNDEDINKELETHKERLALIEAVVEQITDLEKLSGRIRILEEQEDQTDAFKLALVEFERKFNSVDLKQLDTLPILRERVMAMAEQADEASKRMEDLEEESALQFERLNEVDLVGLRKDVDLNNDRIERIEKLFKGLENIEGVLAHLAELDGVVGEHDAMLEKLGNDWAELQVILDLIDFADIEAIPGMRVRLDQAGSSIIELGSRADKAELERAELKEGQERLSKWIRRIEINVSKLDFSKDIEELRIDMQGFKIEMERLALENTNLNNKFKGAFSAIKRRIDEQVVRIDGLEKLAKNLNDLQERLQEALLAIEVHGERITKNSSLIKELNDAYEELQATVDSVDLDLVGAIPDIFQLIEEAEKEREAIFESIDNIEQEQKKMNELIEKLDVSGLIKALKERVEYMQKAVTGLQKQNIEQGKFNADVTTAINKLNEKIKDLGEIEKRVSMLETDLKDSVKELESAIARGEKNTQDLEARVNAQLAELDEGLTSVQKQLRMMSEAFRGLKQDNGEVQKLIVQFKVIIKNYGDKLNEVIGKPDTSKPRVSSFQGSASTEPIRKSTKTISGAQKYKKGQARKRPNTEK